MGIEVSGPVAQRSNADSVELIDHFMGLEPEQFFELARKVMIAIPHRLTEGVHPSFVKNAGYWALSAAPFATAADEFQGFIELTRSGICRVFLKYCDDHPQCEYLVMIDNDEAVPPQAPFQLAQWGKDIVTGVVCSFSTTKGGVFACFTANDPFGIARFPTVMRTKTLPASGLREIETCGTGLICIHKRVIEAMFEEGRGPFEIPEETRRHCVMTGTLKLGEDMAFCERAKSMGYKIWVDFAVRAKHYKLMEIDWPSSSVSTDVRASEWSVAPDDYLHE